jgi:endonuclease YncB( thermonuclease family)
MIGRRYRPTHIAGALAALFAAIFMAVTHYGGKKVEGQVVAVHDGDTITVMRSGKGERVRLYGVDCPELSQPYGRNAKHFSSEHCFGKVVTVKVTDHDRYGRTVGEVILPDGSSLNRELVKAGLAWWYYQYCNDRSLGQLEEEARREKRGLWAGKNPQPPWDYRKDKREEEMGR